MLGVQQVLVDCMAVHRPMHGAAVDLFRDTPFVRDLTSQCKEEYDSYQKQK